ncbi:Copine-like protein, partial [Phytophthora palmivora]
MGCASSSEAFQPIPDSYTSVEEVQKALRQVGLQSSDLIIAVDFTESNLVKGAQTFEGRSLHFVDKTGRVSNPYQTVISAITRVFELFDDDDSIPAFGYGGYPERPLEERYFPFMEDRGCELDEVLQ